MKVEVWTGSESTTVVTFDDPDKEILVDHSLLHSYWNRIKEKKPIIGWSRAKIIRYHSMIVRELVRRRLTHTPINDLDDLLPEGLKKRLTYKSASTKDK